MRHLNETEVVRNIADIANDISIRQAANNIVVSFSIVHLLWNRYRETDGYQDASDKILRGKPLKFKTKC